MNHIRLLIRNQCGSHIIHGLPNPLAFQQNYSCYDGPSESGIFSPLDEPLLTSYLLTLWSLNSANKFVHTESYPSINQIYIGQAVEPETKSESLPQPPLFTKLFHKLLQSFDSHSRFEANTFGPP